MPTNYYGSAWSSDARTMSAYDEPRIEKPEHFGLRPLRAGRGNRQTYVIGYDSEADTRTGHPMLLQFNEPGMTEDTSLLLTIPEKNPYRMARGKFLAYVATRCT